MLLNRKAAGCEDVRTRMFDYIDGALSDVDAAALEAHLAECEPCRRELDERREMLALVKSSSAAVPSSLYGRVMAEVEKTPQDKKVLLPRMRMKPWMGSLAAVAAAVMILVVGRGFLSQGARDEMLGSDPSGARIFDAAGAPADADDRIDIEGENSDKVQYSVADEDISYGSKPPVATMAPEAASPEAPDEYATEDVPGVSVLDVIFVANKADGVALLVCNKSDLDGVIPDVDRETSVVDAITCEHYILEAGVVAKLTGYIELLEHRGADYRAYVPTDEQFERCEIILLTE